MRWVSFTAIALMVACQPAAAGPAQTPEALPRFLDDFAAHASPEQAKEVADAVAASPALAQQLNDLARAGQFTGFTIAAGPPPSDTQFATTIDHGKIVFAADFLAQPAQKRLFDVVEASDILPNNLVFALGALAYHLQHPTLQPPLPTNAESFMKIAAETDARSFIQGWNDVVDAAIHENHDKPLIVSQQGALWLNLRYRRVIPDAAPGLISSSGMIALTDQNVRAVADPLGQINVLDFGAMLGL